MKAIRNSKKKTIDFYTNKGIFIESMNYEETLNFIIMLEDLIDKMQKMNDVDFFNVGKEDSTPIETEIKGEGTPIPSLSNKVIMRVLHTRTEIRIYPNGTTFQKSTSWFEDKHYEVKPKPKKELVKAKQVELQKEESY